MKNWDWAQGVYIHTPFCMQKCIYCDFNSFAGSTQAMQEKYVNCLCQEIKVRALTMPIATEASIYFGGGTPSILPISELERIVFTLKNYGLWQKPREATIEVNPGTADLNKLRAYKELGFDRISFGVQTLQNNELKTIGRIHTAEEALEALTAAQEAGFARISADLIYGLPGQSLESFQATLQRLVATGIKHISVYGLTVEPGTVLAKKLELGQLVLPSEEVNEQMYDFMIDYLTERGLLRYEISNFAVVGEESKHNLVYWRYLPYFGFGCGACSFDGKQRLTNVGNITEYCRNFGSDAEQLLERTQLAEYLFLGLRTTSGINLVEAQERFGIDVLKHFQIELEKYIKLKMILVDQKRENLRLTRQGMKYGNEIFEIFL